MVDDGTTRATGRGDATAIQRERELLRHAKSSGPLATLGAFVRLSGPGWLQSAITLGGGSLAGSLYLGVLCGMSLFWLQPLAMILGIVMLSAISYVTLSTGQRPFDAINRHVSPVLGWGWAIATVMANLVWALPQFSLATAAVRQNLLPTVVGPQAMSNNSGNLLVCGSICVVCIAIVWFYDSGSWGIKVFEGILKIMVAVIVVCFFGVVIKMSFTSGELNWKHILTGLIPDPSLLSSPAKTLAPFIAKVEGPFRQFWIDTIVRQQRDVMVTTVATAVGINMTFLLPYSMLKRGWDKEFRGLARFDLATGLLIPFVLVTGCVVIASASRFHASPASGFLGETDKNGQVIQPAANLVGKYRHIASTRAKYQLGVDAFEALSAEQKVEQIDALPVADKRLAAMLVKRDAFNLAESLAPLTGQVTAHYLFGIGVLGIGMSTIIILMLINGFAVCEMMGVESKGWPHRLACLAPAIGMLGPFIWTGGKAQFWLAVPTSVFAMVLLPIAYSAFYLLMNQKSLLGADMPRGGKRLAWNFLMAIAAGLAALGCLWSLWSRLRWVGILLLAAFVTLVLVVHVVRRNKARV